MGIIDHAESNGDIYFQFQSDMKSLSQDFREPKFCLRRRCLQNLDLMTSYRFEIGNKYHHWTQRDRLPPL